jgi:hypothetical protein
LRQKGFTLMGGPEGSRTPNLLIRSQVLYPIKLQIQFAWILLLPIKLATDNTHFPYLGLQK